MRSYPPIDSEHSDSEYSDDDSHDDSDETPWESDARAAIEEVTQDIQFDEPRGVVYLESGVDHDLEATEEGFSSYNELWYRLIEIGENAWVGSAPFEGGSPVFEPTVDGMVENALDWSRVEDFFKRLSPPKEGEKFFLARNSLVVGAGLAVQIDVAEINDELIRYLAHHPDKMRDLSPRRFEELVAELFKDKGYDVELTPRSRDGGLDIRAYQRSGVGVLLGLVECKRFAADRPVSVEIVRGLYGVVESERANFGVIVTTSRFTKDAQSFQQQNRYRVQLADFKALNEWLRSHTRAH